MSISVAMASYNGEKYIREQLASILSNLTAEDEIVISDDGSTDRTVEIILACKAETNVPVILLEGERKGIIANFENALRRCRGTYIFLADQDDIWAKDKVKTVLAAFSDSGKKSGDCGKVFLVMHDAKVMNEDCTKTLMDSFFAYRGSKAGVGANLLKNRYMGCCMAFRREILKKVLPIPKDIPMHDQWIGLVSDLLYGKSVLVRKPLLLYRRHGQAASDFHHNSVPVMVKNRWKLFWYLWKRSKR